MSDQPFTIDPQTRISAISLRVANLEVCQHFYQEVLGMQVHQGQDGQVWLGPQNGQPILGLQAAPGAPRPVHNATGLYHVAYLYPSRQALGNALRRLVTMRWPLQGFADHLVSEAIYLADPEGNGIELYRDRPRSEWHFTNGRVAMATDPLDVDGVLAEASEVPEEHMPAGTRIGHVHLKVASTSQGEAFYCQALGFGLMARYGPSASFVSAGGYHHHIGMNTWSSAGGPPPAPDATGLAYYQVLLPNPTALEEALDHLEQAGIPAQEMENGWLARDPSSNAVLLSSHVII
jgi:catechol 2,3-dioxygenase